MTFPWRRVPIFLCTYVETPEPSKRFAKVSRLIPWHGASVKNAFVVLFSSLVVSVGNEHGDAERVARRVEQDSPSIGFRLVESQGGAHRDSGRFAGVEIGD